MENNGNRWFVKREHYLNADDYNVCMQPEDSRMPIVCIGSFRGLVELVKFGEMLKTQLAEAVSEEVRSTYTQIVAAIEKEAAACG